MRIAIFVIFVLTFSAIGSKAEKRPNIILILADDVGADMFSCYGQPETAQTPNIDRIAEKGVMFRTCYAPAICGPSRALIMTGKYSTSTGVYHNGVWLNNSRQTLFTKQHSWSKLFKEAGYETAMAGKWHCGAKNPWDKELGFTEFCEWSGPSKVSAHIGQDIYETGLRKKIKQSDNRYWHPSILQNHKYVEVDTTDFGPDIRCDFIMDFMERNVKANKPFIAYWPTVIPHGPYTSTPHHGKPMDIQPEKIDLKGLSGEEKKAAQKKNDEYMHQRFTHLIEYMDFLVGKLMSKIEELGISDNTYIIFCADNGTASTAKNRGVERGVHVPYLVMGPDVKNRGVSDELTDFSDIAPTLLDMAGIEVPDNYTFDGKSQLPYLRGERESHREWIYSYVGIVQLIRTKDFLLEAISPMSGKPNGRFYKTGKSRFGRGYERIEGVENYLQDRKKLDEILTALPPLQKDNEYWKTPKGKNWLDEYLSEPTLSKSLHNHERYRFYNEED